MFEIMNVATEENHQKESGVTRDSSKIQQNDLIEMDSPKTEGAEQTSATQSTENGGAKSPYQPHRGVRYGCYLLVKRSFDLFTSTLFILIFSWLYIILAIAVKCSDGGAVFYKHPRVGKNGKTIYIRKFRSMIKNADKVQVQLTPEQLEQYRREYKVDDDPRITKLGKFLRKTSLDELPNVFAIFTGSISVVGPRPIMREEAEEKYGDDMTKLLSVKPGMIGWWGVNGRNNCTYGSGERQKVELYYVDHCSIWLDIKIIFLTLIKVIKRDGAK